VSSVQCPVDTLIKRASKPNKNINSVFLLTCVAQSSYIMPLPASKLKTAMACFQCNLGSRITILIL
jgi:hypothetical protein